MRAEAALILILAAASVSAETYYADVTVDVDAAGEAYIAGRTNHPDLTPRATGALTSKRGAYWLFNLTLPEEDVFQEYVYEINLPPAASVNYVKTKGQFRITSKDDRIKVTGLEENKPLEVVVQYQFQTTEGRGYQTAIALAALAAAAAAAAVLKKRLARGKAPGDQGSEMLTERQKDILKAIREEGRPVNQAVICRKLGLPKSSVSRNVETLARVGLVEKTRTGMSTMLSAKQE